MCPDNYIGFNFSGLDAYQPSRQYPVTCRDIEGLEGAQKRFRPFPTVKDVRMIALFGLQRIAPQVYDECTDELIETYLTASISELEMQYSVSFTPTEYFYSGDYMESCLQANWLGVKLPKWPASQVVEALLKFSHTQSTAPIMMYELPPNWIALQANGQMNVICDFGALAVTQRGGDGIPPYAGVRGYLYGPYRPAAIEIRYQAGFTPERFPACVADWVITHTSMRLLTDISFMIFPQTSTSATVDGVTQGAGLPGPQFLLQRIQLLAQKFKQQTTAIRGAWGKNIVMSVMGSSI